jgi:peptidylprolyl isomerase
VTYELNIKINIFEPLKKRKSMKYLVVFVLFVLVIAGCNTQPKVVTLDNGIKYSIDSVGNGKVAKKDDFVSIHFQGWYLTDKDKNNLFADWSKDSSKKAQSLGSSREFHPINIKLSPGQFIKGSELGIEGMKVGETRTIIIPDSLAYGKKGLGPVPPNSDIKVVVDLLDIKVPVEQWKVDTTAALVLPSGLKFIPVQEGTGAKADSGKIVKVNYSGYFLNGKKFDSSVDRGQPIQFALGTGRVIPGWEEGIALMKEGGKAELIIPPDLAYGEKGRGEIPPNSTLVFDVELLEVK